MEAAFALCIRIRADFPSNNHPDFVSLGQGMTSSFELVIELGVGVSLSADSRNRKENTALGAIPSFYQLFQNVHSLIVPPSV